MSDGPYRRFERPRGEDFMNPARYRLPQGCSGDRQRGRRAVLALRRDRYVLRTDNCPGNPSPGFALPPYLESLPEEAAFSAPKFGRFMAHKLVARANFAMVKLAGPRRFSSFNDYARVFRLIPPPRGVISRWRTDEEFARQRVSGVNPMSLRRCEADPGEGFWRAAAPVLAGYDTTLRAALDQGRVFLTRYHALADARIQARVAQKNNVLASPTCLFYVDRVKGLVPVAIQLRAPGSAPNPVFTPLSAEHDWLAAKLHAQAADAHAHEGVYHLLDTHLVVETLAVCAARNLHPDHPIAQLMHGHFEFNLAINNLARRDLLGPDGPIENAMAAGVGGVLDAARESYARWDFFARSVPREVARRGLDDRNVWPEHAWRDSAQPLWKAVDTLVRMILRPWYPTDFEVVGDYELQGWVGEAASPKYGGIPGFPSRLTSFEDMVAVVREVLYRGSAGHAAVNNGQFDAYGFIPNAPGSFNLSLPTDESPGYTEERLVAAMPDRRSAAGQIMMTWILSEPTQRNILRAGEMPAFAREHCWAAHDALIAFRQSLIHIGEANEARNAAAAVPYPYLSPWNVSRSIET